MKYLMLWLLCSTVALQAQAQTLHLIMAINTNEYGREVDRTEDFNQMRRFWQETANYLNVPIQIIHLGENRFTSTDVLNTCQNLNLAVGNKDIVIFYYSGHGANDRSNKWPVLALKDRLFETKEIIRIIREKNPKFMMVMADCCNSFLDGNSIPLSFNISDGTIAIYRKLFLNFPGQRQVLISASSPGENSWSHKVTGSYWGMAFREAVRRAANGADESVTWETILENAKNNAYILSSHRQTAQCEVIFADSVED